jgi:hypothetical protein
MKNIKPFSVQGHLSEAVSAPSMEGREAINRANAFEFDHKNHATPVGGGVVYSYVVNTEVPVWSGIQYSLFKVSKGVWNIKMRPLPKEPKVPPASPMQIKIFGEDVYIAPEVHAIVG